MSVLSQELDRYLSIRRSLGYTLSSDERILRNFVSFADTENTGHVSSPLFLRWKEAFGKANNHTWAHRLSTVRVFARWLHSLDARHEVLPQSLIPSRSRRPRPYIYSEDEVRQIVQAAAELPSINGVRPLTCSTLFGLIAVTGLRVSEALALNTSDVDFDSGVITIRKGKLGKARLVPVADSVRVQLVEYARERDRLLGAASEALFVADRGDRLTDCGARYSFAAASRSVGLRSFEPYRKHGRGPRIHDLRHTFAVRTLLSWYRNRDNPSQEMIKLSTYLGHADPTNTYWYIEAVPELLELASKRAEEVQQ